MLPDSQDSSTLDSYQLRDGIYHFQHQSHNSWFEKQYSQVAEPWRYSLRGGELYRHRFSIAQLQKFCPNPSSLLELGCGSGSMTTRLATITKKLYATDVSLSAVKACKQKCDPLASNHNCCMEYHVTTTPGLPFADNSFEAVTICDGLIGWWFSDEQKHAALKDTHRVLKKGGHVILSDYTTPDQFAKCIELVNQSDLSIVSIVYLYDRPWYTFESIVKKLRIKLLRPVVASTRVAKLLHKAGSIVGTSASRHIIIIAKKN